MTKDQLEQFGQFLSGLSQEDQGGLLQALPEQETVVLQAFIQNANTKEEQLRKTILQKLQETSYNRAEQVQEPGYLFTIGNVPCMPIEGIIAISGEAKKGKSQFLTILEAVLLGNVQFGDIRRRYDPNKQLTVLHVDTEQTPYDVQCNINRLYAITGWTDNSLESHNFHYLRLRREGVQERLKLIDEAVSLWNPDVVVIDGCRDLVFDFNDPRESGLVIERLMKYADDRRAVFTILHVNGGTDKMRGHLGTELLNKCSDRWTVTKVNNTFQTKHISRGREVLQTPSFCFADNGTLTPCEAITPADKEESKQERYTRAIKDIFSKCTEITYKELSEQLTNGEGIKLSTAKNWIKSASEDGIIQKNDQGKIICNLPF